MGVAGRKSATEAGSEDVTAGMIGLISGGRRRRCAATSFMAAAIVEFCVSFRTLDPTAADAPQILAGSGAQCMHRDAMTTQTGLCAVTLCGTCANVETNVVFTILLIQKIKDNVVPGSPSAMTSKMGTVLAQTAG